MRLLTPSLMLLCLFVLGGVIFKSTTPTRCSTILQNDSIFVLTGDMRRIPFALRALNKYPAAKLYIIGAGGRPDTLPKRVFIESDSKSTYQNAVAIKRIADRDGLNRIVLITTVDHFNRARYLVSREIGDVEIVACPVPLNGMDVSKRLERWGTEYLKYIGTLFGWRES